MNSNRKPVITKIKFTKQQQEEIDKLNRHDPIEKTKTATNNSRGYTYEYRSKIPLSFEGTRRRMTQLYGGLCSGGCGQWPDYKFTYDVSSEGQPAKRIERYCSSCYDKWKSR